MLYRTIHCCDNRHSFPENELAVQMIKMHSSSVWHNAQSSGKVRKLKQNARKELVLQALFFSILAFSC